MASGTLPVIAIKDWQSVTSQPDELISLLIGSYQSILSSDPSGKIQESFTTEQHILMAFDILESQVMSGGFIQLVENGYGPYIFDTPLSDYLRSWGAVDIAAIIDQARVIYLSKKDLLEREKTLEEVAKLYQQHPEFEPLEKEFTDNITEAKRMIAGHIIGHIDSCAIVS